MTLTREPDAPAIAIRDLHVRLAGEDVLQGISLDIPRGTSSD
ncbi:MAG: hypothetical protein R3E97_03615 [Candidatus Eisenbacteria bacterium]